MRITYEIMGVKGLMRTCSLRVGTKMTLQMFTATLNFRAEVGLGVKEITPVGGGGRLHCKLKKQLVTVSSLI